MPVPNIRKKQEFLPVNFSRTDLTELMIPAYANFGGKIHGGIILSLMDKVAYACAAKHAGNYCVTVSIDSVDFRIPIEVGEMVKLRASVNYVGRTSMIIGIKVTAENVLTGEEKHTNTSYFTMVAQDEDHRSTQVPGLILETRDDIRRFLEAIRRRELKKAYNSELVNAKTSLMMDADTELHKLDTERCIIRTDNQS